MNITWQKDFVDVIKDTDKLTIKWGRVWVSGKTKGWSIEEGFSPLPISTSPFPFFAGLSVFVNCIHIFFVR